MEEIAGAKALLRVSVQRLEKGADATDIRQEFGHMLQNVTPAAFEAAKVELIQEGMPFQALDGLATIHQELFRESAAGTEPLASAGHPIHILMAEHNAILRIVTQLGVLARDEATGSSEQVERVISELQSSESHYVREENVLFPYLEKHGITGPTAAMWTEHNQIRELEKALYQLLEGRKPPASDQHAALLSQAVKALAEMLTTHFHKENSVLFPASLRVLKPVEWREARQEFDELGYARFTPSSATVPWGQEGAAPATARPPEEGMVEFETGSLSHRQIEGLLNSLPVDVTFVGSDDRVRYFSQTRDRIFPRTKAVIGRTVQQCHPQKSLHVVNQILADFKAGTRESAEFWIALEGRLIHIRYFPVRDPEGAYLGCLEVTQDITDIQKITGEKRLL